MMSVQAPQFITLLMLILWGITAKAALTVVDDLGQTLTLPRPALRIVTLAPHLTEDLFALGAGNTIIGTVDYSDYPPAARGIPRIGGYNGFDLERIRALQPDLILAWHTGNPAAQLEKLKALRIPMYFDNSQTLQDIPRALQRLGTLTGKKEAAEAEAKRFSNRIDGLRNNFAAKKKLRVFFQVWEHPLLTINKDQIISDVLRLCGAENIFASLPSLVPSIDEEAVLRSDPDVIMTSDSGNKGKASLARWQRWGSMKAVRSGHLAVLPPDILERMSPRLADGAEATCKALDTIRTAEATRTK